MEKSNYEKMIAGEPYNGVDLELFELAATARQRMAKLTALPIDDREGKAKALRELFGTTHEYTAVIRHDESPFPVAYLASEIGVTRIYAGVVCDIGEHIKGLRVAIQPTSHGAMRRNAGAFLWGR